MAEKSNFLSFRADNALFRWIKAYAKKRGISTSDVIREALLELKCRRDAADEAELGTEFEVLRSELGNMFKVVKTERGVLFEKIEPGIVKLG
jgi:hypothetical protein